MTVLIVLVATAVLSFSQATAQKRLTPPPKLDNWQKSKECAAQAEKVMSDKPAFSHNWSNHYSPKYNRCFISDIVAVHGEGAGKTFPEYTNDLIDAFERTTLARWASETIKKNPDDVLSCRIDFKPVDCETAKAFIADHMKN